MRTLKIAALVTALGVSGALLAPSTQAAQARLSTTTAATPTASFETRVVSVDVDGDRKLDTVTVEQSGPDKFVVNVVTASGKDDVAQFTSTIDDDWGVEPWYGAAKLDGRKGYELILLTRGADGVTFRVLTWRSGALVFEKAPKPRAASKDWYVVSVEAARYAYRFSTSNGHRYVKRAELYPSGKYWKGKIVKSVWRSGAWHKVSTKSVKLTKTQAKPYAKWLSGVKVIAKP